MAQDVNIARRGHGTAEPAVVELVAGDLRAELAGTDLQAVRFRGSEVVQRIYMAVRDVPWNTIPGVVRERTVVQGDDSFRVTFTQRHTYDDIDVEWDGLIEGTADGQLIYEMKARANRPFRYSKIGLNIHHGLAEYRGRSFRAQTQSGEVTGVLSEDIEPQLVRDGSLTAMFDHFDAISFDLDSATATFQFEGDRFETQDHRNWSDSNYKTYGTPLSFGFPRDIDAGDELWQRMTLSVTGGNGRAAIDEVIRVQPARGPAAVPRIGHNLSGGESSVSEFARQVLRTAQPEFLRVEVQPGDDVEDRLAETRELSAGQCGIELVVAVEPERIDETARVIANALAKRHDDVARVVVLAASAGFSEFKTATPPELPNAVSATLRERGVKVPVFSGTEQFFNELNRARPDYGGLDGVVFSLNPQVHACIDRALMQNAAGISDIAAFCRRLYPNAELSVGPVHLLGPNGPFPGGPQADGGPPQALDVRHVALFGAAWTVAFLQAAVQVGLENVTLFDLVGSRGLAEHPDPSLRAAQFPSVPGRAYPLLWVLRRLHDVAASSVDPVFGEGGGADRCALVGLRSEHGSRLLVANLRDHVADVRLAIGAEQANVAVLDETNVSNIDPLVDAGPRAGSHSADGGVLALLLRPYAVACVDVSLGSSLPGGLG